MPVAKLEAFANNIKTIKDSALGISRGKIVGFN